MQEKKIKYILFDAANTLIHKPALWPRIIDVLEQHRIAVNPRTLRYHHKLLSEFITFPDRTSEAFYASFNKELLLSLGIIPTPQLLDDIFRNCTYMPWEKFEDTQWLQEAKVKIGVLSNFSNNLPDLLSGLFGDIFSDIIVSEIVSVRKPDAAFYEHAIATIGLAPEEIVYVGDSIKLDVMPAAALGLNATLIDRDNFYNGTDIPVIGKLSDIGDQYLIG